MKYAAAGLGLLGLFACSPKAETPATETAVASSPGCSGEVLPVTGVCTTDAALFPDADPKADLQGPNCVWGVREARRTGDEAVVFRAQDCTKDGLGSASYAFRNSRDLEITYTYSASEPSSVSTIAYVFEIPDGKTAEDVALTMMSEAPEAERGRCKVQAEPSGYFQLAPDEAYLAELTKSQDGPISACGPFGMTQESTVYWEGTGKRAIFHATGQDTPSWDPNSFKFYTRDGSGKWVFGAVTPPH